MGHKPFVIFNHKDVEAPPLKESQQVNGPMRKLNPEAQFQKRFKT